MMKLIKQNWRSAEWWIIYEEHKRNALIDQFKGCITTLQLVLSKSIELNCQIIAVLTEMLKCVIIQHICRRNDLLKLLIQSEWREIG